MAGVKGRSGRPKDKPWADALRLAAMEDGPNGFKKLRCIAQKCVDAAMAGDMQAIKEIGDRLDGKPAQEATLTLDDKREATDWSREELVQFIHRHAANGSSGTAKAEGRGGEPDSLH